ncbi:type I restriction enzyme S subunit [Pedobacter sp. UYP30]|uniref:restriction endonuclease subunit S n=1 Tax=Pedobacter sp. UYP30 TaxID=1756400 RepID=UPI00339316F4
MSKEKLVPELRFPEFLEDREWSYCAIGSVGNVITGGTPSKEEVEFWGGNFVWTTAQDFKKKYILNSVQKLTQKGKDKSRVIPKDSILVTCIASIGLNAINKVECATNQQINSIICNLENYFEFVYYSISRNSQRLKDLAGRTAVPIINKSIFEKFIIQKPESIQEQQKIASCLSSLDELIEAHRQKLETLNGHKKGLLQNLFPQEGETVPRYRFKEFENDGEWEDKILGKMAELTSSKRVHLADYVSSGVPFFRGKEISQLKNNQIPDDVLYISKNQYNEIKEKYGVPNKGDILITAVGTLGNVYCIKNDDEFYFKDGNLIWMKNISVDSSFLEIVLDVDKEKIMGSAIGSSQKALTMVALNKLQFKIPENQKEQQKIASCLSSLNMLIIKQTEKTEQLHLHKKGLMQGLFPKISD